MKIIKSILPTVIGDVAVYNIINNNRASVKISSLGAGIISIFVPDKNGDFDDVVLGYSKISDYINDKACAGKTPGRYANRISKGKFTINGKSYQLSLNDFPNSLHGGNIGFANKLWDSKIEDKSILFTLYSEDGDEYYPGNLIVKVRYEWNENNELIIGFEAKCDMQTIVNLTNHAYFNLAGENSGSILNHKLQLFASQYLPVDESFIPTGEYLQVKNTPMDFREPMKIGDGLKTKFDVLEHSRGYNHCWVVDNWIKDKLKKIAILSDTKSGRVLEIETTQPSVQVYTGNYLNGSPINKSGRSYNDYDGIAIECQGMPDAPNHSNFPSQLLREEETYHQIIKYKFKTVIN
ncbi:MAG: aldose epimerase family protein [Muribaculaceae bacterium]